MVVDGCHWLVCLLMVGVFVDGWCDCRRLVRLLVVGVVVDGC